MLKFLEWHLFLIWKRFSHLSLVYFLFFSQPPCWKVGQRLSSRWVLFQRVLLVPQTFKAWIMLVLNLEQQSGNLHPFFVGCIFREASVCCTSSSRSWREELWNQHGIPSPFHWVSFLLCTHCNAMLFFIEIKWFTSNSKVKLCLCILHHPGKWGRGKHASHKISEAWGT